MKQLQKWGFKLAFVDVYVTFCTSFIKLYIMWNSGRFLFSYDMKAKTEMI